MVGIKIRYAVLTLSAAVLTILCAMGQDDQNHYTLLQRQQRQLQLRAESVSERLASSRRLYETEPSDSLAQVVGTLEYQYSAIVERSGSIRRELQQIDSVRTILAAEEAKRIEEQKATAAQQIERHPERDAFNNIMASFESDERLVIETAARYAAAYARLAETLDAYRSARNIASLDTALDSYNALASEAKTLADSIADDWDYISIEKVNAYSALADSLGLAELKNDYIARARRTEEELEALVGHYSDGDIAMYPLRKRDLLDFERRLAANIGLNETADSLARAAVETSDDAYRFELLRIPAKADAPFEEVVIGTKPRYASTKNIGAIAPPSKGYVYSILLGGFKEQPKMSIFRNAAPLFTEKRADGRTYYYAGLYPTEQSASDGFELLRKAGFKQPMVVMWYNSLRRDDFTPSLTTQSQTSKKAVYKVEISGAPAALPDKALAIVKRDAPSKELSKIADEDGTYTYTVGTFTSRREAETLSTAMSPLLKSTVIEIVLQQ